MAKKKTMVFQNSPSERFDYVKIEGERVKTYVVSGRVNQSAVQNFLGKDFEYKVGDLVDWHGRDFTVIDVGEKVELQNQNIVLYQVTLNRAIMDESELTITPDMQQKWERKINRILNKQRAKQDEELRLQQLEADQKRVEALARARRKKEQLKAERAEYEGKCATSIGGLEL